MILPRLPGSAPAHNIDARTCRYTSANRPGHMRSITRSSNGLLSPPAAAAAAPPDLPPPSLSLELLSSSPLPRRPTARHPGGPASPVSADEADEPNDDDDDEGGVGAGAGAAAGGGGGQSLGRQGLQSMKHLWRWVGTCIRLSAHLTVLSALSDATETTTADGK